MIIGAVRSSYVEERCRVVFRFDNDTFAKIIFNGSTISAEMIDFSNLYPDEMFKLWLKSERDLRRNKETEGRKREWMCKVQEIIEYERLKSKFEKDEPKNLWQYILKSLWLKS